MSMFRRLAVALLGLSSPISAGDRFIPEIDGTWWQIAGDPDLGDATSPRQQPVDFGVWQAADGTWQLWSCIRHTKCGGKTRLFYRWEGRQLTDRHWTPMGIAMKADTSLGETPGGLQAPHVTRVAGTYYMVYGDWRRICLAKSTDGKIFTRVLNDRGQPDLFGGPYGNSRDPMLLRVGDLFHCYYMGHRKDAQFQSAIFCRTSRDLRRWSEAKMVSAGGSAAKEDNWYGGDAECPFVVEKEGLFYLFRNQRYGVRNLNTQYCSPNPQEFGVGDDRYRIGTLPVAAPEIIRHGGQDYIAALLPSLKGIRIAKLKWRKESRGEEAAARRPIQPVVRGVEAPWPQFHGPHRDNISRETGLLKRWPERGPRLIWTYRDCGRGYASVSRAEGLLFTSGDFGREEMVLALDLNGKLVWKSPNGRSWTGASPGARCTPTYHDGLVYHMNPTHRIAAYRARSGKELWGVDLEEGFDAEYGGWAMAENPVVEDDAVFCVPGGSRGRIVSLDRHTGATLWANTEIKDRAAYCSPIVVTHGGVRQLITLMQRSVVSVDVSTGKLLWSHAHVTPYNMNVTRPIYHEGHVYVSSGYAAGGRLLKISPDSRRVTEVWANKEQDNCHTGVLLVGGYLYGSGCRQSRRGFVCVDWRSGKTMWADREIWKASLTSADGLIYCLGHLGKVSLVDVSPRGARVISQFSLPSDNKYDNLAHPVVVGGRLYLRQGNVLFAYDVRASSES